MRESALRSASEWSPAQPVSYSSAYIRPLTIAVAIAGLGVAALAGSLLPAQRAARVQPMEAVRYE